MPAKKSKLNTDSSVDKKERRKDLNCSFCPPNRVENAGRKPKRGEKKAKYKSARKGK